MSYLVINLPPSGGAEDAKSETSIIKIDQCADILRDPYDLFYYQADRSLQIQLYEFLYTSSVSQLKDMTKRGLSFLVPIEGAAPVQLDAHTSDETWRYFEEKRVARKIQLIDFRETHSIFSRTMNRNAIEAWRACMLAKLQSAGVHMVDEMVGANLRGWVMQYNRTSDAFPETAKISRAQVHYKGQWHNLLQGAEMALRHGVGELLSFRVDDPTQEVWLDLKTNMGSFVRRYPGIIIPAAEPPPPPAKWSVTAGVKWVRSPWMGGHDYYVDFYFGERHIGTQRFPISDQYLMADLSVKDALGDQDSRKVKVVVRVPAEIGGGGSFDYNFFAGSLVLSDLDDRKPNEKYALKQMEQTVWPSHPQGLSRDYRTEICMEVTAKRIQ